MASVWGALAADGYTQKIISVSNTLNSDQGVAGIEVVTHKASD